MYFEGRECWRGSTNCHKEFWEAAVPKSSLGRTVKTKANGDGRQLVWETNGPILLSSCPAADGAGHSGEAQTVL